MSESACSRAPRQLRIIHCFRAPVGGVLRHVCDLAEAQAAMGHAVGILCDASTGDAYSDQRLAKLNSKLELGVTRVPMQRAIGLGDLSAAWRAYNLLKGLQPDIVHGHGAKGGVYARLFGTLIGPKARRFYSPHGGSLHYDPTTAKGRLIFAAERGLGRLCDGLFFVCDFERQTYSRKVGEPKSPSGIVYNGVRSSEFGAAPLIEKPFDLLFIGELRDLKGPDLLIEAIPLAEKALGRQIRAVFVGNGEKLEDCKALVSRLDLGGQVEFRPAMPARQAFELSRLVVVPSRAEALPYIVLEALAAGRAVIASAVGGIPEIFGADSQALVAADVSSLDSKLAQALVDLPTFQRLMPSTEALRARFSVAVMAQQITQTYGSDCAQEHAVGQTR